MVVTSWYSLWNYRRYFIDVSWYVIAIVLQHAAPVWPLYISVLLLVFVSDIVDKENEVEHH